MDGLHIGGEEGHEVGLVGEEIPGAGKGVEEAVPRGDHDPPKRLTGHCTCMDGRNRGVGEQTTIKKEIKGTTSTRK